MLGSFRVGHLFGIEVRCDWSFILFTLAILQLTPEGVATPLFILMLGLFGSVLLHELGHAMVARFLGIRVIDIRLWPLGGMARMGEIPEEPRVECLIAAAGPAVNLVLALLAWTTVRAAEHMGAEPGLGLDFAQNLAGINLMLGLLNLLPGFPMDGGRLFRALLARKRDYPDATWIAVRVGRWVACLGFLLALFYGDVFGLMAVTAIAGFIWIAGTRELISVRVRHGQSPFGTVMPAAQRADAERAKREVRGEWHPRADELLPESTPKLEPGGARRPALWELPEPTELETESRGISEGYVRALELFRGQLGRPGDLRGSDASRST